MKIQDKKVAIIGGGPGGLTLARLLQVKGLSVKVYERDLNENIRPQGAPLDLHEESGLAAIKQAGLLEEFKKNYMLGADRLKIMDKNGTIHFNDHNKKLEENFENPSFRPEIDRGALREILLNSLNKNTVVWNSHFLSMSKQGNGWSLNFENKDSVYADIVIGADGPNSKIRSYLTPTKPIYSGITMLEGNISNATINSPIVNSFLEGGKIMAFGNGKNIMIGQKANNTIGFYISLKIEENYFSSHKIDFNDKEQLTHWFKKEYEDWNFKIWEELLINAKQPIIPRPICYMPLDQNWITQPNLTIIGDAAHVMPPFAGEGVNMAMLDALELSENLISENSLFQEYEIKMRKRSLKITQLSLDNGEKMHNKNALSFMLDFFNNKAV